MSDTKHIIRLVERLQGKSPSGFAIAFHIRFTTPDFLFQTYPKAWIDIYSEQGMVMHDPIVRWGFANTQAVRWSDLEGSDALGVLEKSKPYGMNYGVAFAIDTGGSRTVAGCARPDREFTDAEIADIQADVADLHKLTASKDGMTDALRRELKQMSIRFTHHPKSDSSA